MPWCPKCKSEYREGVTYCEDCKVDLVESLSGEQELVDLALLEKKAVAEKFKNYLQYSNIISEIVYSEENAAYIVRVSEKDAKKAKKHYMAFTTVESEQSVDDSKEESIENSNMNDAMEESDPLDWVRSEETSDDSYDGESKVNEYKETDETNDDKEDSFSSVTDDEVLYPEATTYIKKADQTKELKITAATFFIFGFLGIAYLILNIIGIISLTAGIIPYIVMGLVFTGFIIVGINSLLRSKKTAEEAVLEEETTNLLLEWLNNNMNLETLNTIKEDYIKSSKEKNISDEIIYLKQVYAIKKKITQDLGEMDDSYLETIIEEFYNDHFADQSQDDIEE